MFGFSLATNLKLTFLLTLCAALTPVTTCLADWPQWRGPDRNGFVAAESLVDKLPSQGLQPTWKVDALPGGTSGGWSSPVVSDGRVYVFAHTKTKVAGADLGKAKYPWLAPDKRVGMSDEEYKEYEVKRRDENERRSKAFEFEERLLCVDLASGELIWDRKSPSKYSRFTQSGTPCVVAGRIYVLGAARNARCHDAETGEVLWTQTLPGDFRDEFFASSFVVSGNTALVACGPLVAINADDGAVLWQGDAAMDYQSHSSPAVWQSDNGAVAIVNTAGGTTQAYQIADGKKLWELASGTGSSSPVVAGDLLLTYGSSRKSGLTAYDLIADAPEKEPEVAWRFQGAADSGTCPVVRGDAVFVQGEKRIAKVSLADGKKVWQTTMKISTPKYTSLIAAGDQLIYGWEGIQCFDAQSGKFEQLYDAKIDDEAVLIGAEDLRVKLDLARLGKEEGGQAKVEKLWQQKAVKSGPLACSTPAFSDGKLVVRLRDALVCYDMLP